MVHVFYTVFIEPLNSAVFNIWLAKLTPAMQRQIGRYRQWQDAHRSLLGKALLLTGLHETGNSNLQLAELHYTEYQRPCFEGGPQFNISHSGNVVVCAIGDKGLLGIDVEEVNPIPLDDFSDLFNPLELDRIYADPQDYKPFYTLWTQKEAFLKAVGSGLNVPLNQVKIREGAISHGGVTCFLTPLQLADGYICHVATTTKNPQIITSQINF